MEFRLFASIFMKMVMVIGRLKSLVQGPLIKMIVIGLAMKYSLTERIP